MVENREESSGKLWVVLGLLGIMMCLSLLFVISQGIRPKPQGQINPSSFSNPESVGAVVYRRMFKEWKSHSLIILQSAMGLDQGSLPWQGFLKTALVEGEQISLVVLSEGLSVDVPQGIEVVRYSSLLENPPLQIVSTLNSGKKVIVIVNGADSSWPAWREGLVVPSILIEQTIVDLRETVVAGVRSSCDQGIVKSCAWLNIARKVKKMVKKKTWDSKHWIAALEKIAKSDFILYLQPPAGD